MPRDRYNAVPTGDEATDRNLDNVERALGGLDEAGLTDAKLTDPITWSGAVTVAVRHGLGRPVRDVIPCLPSTNANLYRGTAHANPKQFINITASAATVCRLLLF